MGRQFLLGCSSPWNWGCFPENSMNHCQAQPWSVTARMCSHPERRRKALHTPCPGKNKGIEGMRDLCEAEQRGTARPQHLTHPGLSPWIKAAKHGGRCLGRGAIPASGQSTQRRVREKSHRNIEWFELGGILKLIQFHPWQGLEQGKL